MQQASAYFFYGHIEGSTTLIRRSVKPGQGSQKCNFPICSNVSVHLDKVPLVLADPDKVIVDPDYPDSTHIYYRMFELESGERIGLAVPVFTKATRYVYTVHSWKGERVKGEARGLTITWLKR